MSFLAPAFLIGLAAIVLPILIHLRHRERREAVLFPSLMFLQKIPFRSVRRQRLRHLLLLMLRAGALVLLALAFARPLLDAPRGAALPLQGARERVLLLDRSYSMGYGDRWSRAVEAARREIDSLGAEDKGALVLFSDRAEGVVAPTKDKAALRGALEAARVGSRGTRYGPALRLAQQWLEAAEAPRKEVTLISDFQKVGWEGGEEARLPEGAALTWVYVGESEPANVLLTGLGLQRDFAAGRERVLASVRLANKGPRPARDVAVALEVGGRAIEEKRVSLPAMAASTVVFEPFALPAGVTRGLVRIAGDPLPADDTLHFVLTPGQEVSVLVVEDDGGGPSQSLYLKRALDIGDRPRFRAEVRRRGAVSPAELSKRAVVILNDTPALAPAASRALRALVEGGGGLVAVLGDEASLGWLPGALGPAVDRTAELGASLAFLDYDHPALALFKGPKSGDFSAPRFLRYRRYKPAEGARVLARYDDGAPALVEDRIGRGRLFVFTSGLDASWNDLPLRPVFLPLVHQLVKHAAGHAEEKPVRLVGEVLELARPPAGAATTVVAPSGERRRLAPGERYVELDEPGFYEIRSAEGGRERVASVAVNVDTAESDLASLDPEEIAHVVTRRTTSSGEAASAAETPEERERRQALWWYVLVGVLLLLAAETVLSNRLSGAAR